MNSDEKDQYPLLREYLNLKGIPLKPAFTVSEVAQMFEVSSRTIQSRIARGRLKMRDLPGRAKILPIDLEEMLSRLHHGDQPRSSTATPINGPKPRTSHQSPHERAGRSIGTKLAGGGRK
jgi:hypothetical protein